MKSNQLCVAKEHENNHASRKSTFNNVIITHVGFVPL